MYFSDDLILGVDWADIQMIAVNTPIDENHAPNLQRVFHAAKNISKHMKNNKIIVNKCTVPIGTLHLVKDCIVSELKIRDAKFSVSIAANPEFLKEGEAIHNFLHPARIVIGVEDKQTKKILLDIYAPIQKVSSKIICTNIKNAEFSKYAANCMLATRISFMNEMAHLADKFDVDINHVKKIMASDPRIGRHFLSSGCGYGGSCLPKDVRALINIGQSMNQSMELLEAVEKINNKQKNFFLELIQKRFENVLKYKHFAIWGLAFKANTSDMRESASIEIINGLLKMSATISVYDPFAMSEAKKNF